MFIKKNQPVLDQDEIMLDFGLPDPIERPQTAAPIDRPTSAAPEGRQDEIKPIRQERPKTAKIKKAPSKDEFGSSSEEEDMTPEQKKQRKQ